MAPHLTDTEMIELTLTTLRHGVTGPGTAAAVEIRRRWDAATLHHNHADTDADDHTHPDADPESIEQARCLLGAFTLVYELWELQRAGVEPDALHHHPDTTDRVGHVLDRDLHRRDDHNPQGGSDLVPRDGYYTARTDPRDTARRYLAHWAKLALFAHPDDLYDHQYKLAGQLHPDLLEHQRSLCAHALARLRGPWSPDAVLSGPTPPKPYWLARPVNPPLRDEPVRGLDTALGRPGEPVTTNQIRISQAVAEAEVAAEVHRLAGVPRSHLVALLPAVHHDGDDPLRPRLTAEFLAAALGVTRLAADHILRVDGRTVPDHAEHHTLRCHALAAADPTGTSLPTTGLTAAGLHFAFRLDPELGSVLGQIDAVGITHHVDYIEDVRDILTLLQRPDAPGIIAAMWLLGAPAEQDHATRLSTAWWPPRHTPRNR